jgi:hypothetical protein
MGSDLETSHDPILELRNMEEIEYIPFYGELKMTTFTTEDRKEASKKKPKKEKVVLTQSEPEVAEQPIVVEVVAPVEEEWVKPLEEYTATDFALINDPPEPGITDVAAAPKGANVVRRGFTTIQMAHAYKNALKNPEEFVIVEVREGIFMDGPILAHYVVHKNEEL